MSLDHIRAPSLAGVPHGFFGRAGGVSRGVVAGLNCGLGSGDDPVAVAENRRRATDAVLPDGRLVGLYQVHGADAVTVLTCWGDEARPQADALVTDRPGLVLGILTADCAPVLLADVAAGVVGAAHAGWKGALAGVTDAALDAMEALGAQRERIVAAIGPTIARASFEVGEDLIAHFTDADPANARFLSDGAGQRHFDLEGYVAHRLAVAGVRRVAALGLDTYADPDADGARFYSYRRATHRHEPTYGRQLAAIAIPQE
ncbi:MAG: peptidoglycan editing factor PgeF [Pseudomonadota bacterium]